MIGKDEIAEAARYADARAEELGLPGWCEQYGIELDGLAYVAEQRAIRAGMALEGKDPASLPRDRMTAVRLTPAVNDLIPFLAATVMDGIAIGFTMKERGVSDAQYAAVCDAIDSMKSDDEDTDVSAAKVLDALGLRR